MRYFTQELVESESRRSLRNARLFERINVGPFSLSIQANEYVYSKPRQTLNVMEDYTHWEVAMFTLEGEWVHPVDLGVPLPFAGVWEPGESAVGGYIPTVLVQALFTWCILQGEKPEEEIESFNYEGAPYEYEEDEE